MIDIETKGTRVRVTPDVASYCAKRLEVLEKHIAPDDTMARAAVEFEKMTAHRSGNIFRAEITLRTREGHFRAEATADSLYAAIDAMQKEIERELRRKKEKKTGAVRTGGRKIKRILRSA